MGQAYAELFPGKLKGFVSIDSAPLQRKYVTGIELWLLKRMEPVYRHYPWKSLLKTGSKGVATSAYGQALMHEMMMAYDGDRERYAKLSGHGFRILAQAMEAGLAYKIPCPALLVCGEKDRAGSCIRYNKAWHKHTGIPLVWIRNAGHNANNRRPGRSERAPCKIPRTAVTGGHSHFRQGARAGRLDIALYRYRPIRVCAGEYDFMFLAPGTPGIVTAAGTAVFVIKQKEQCPKSTARCRRGGEPLAFGVGELRHPNRNGRPSVILCRFCTSLPRCEKRRQSLSPRARWRRCAALGSQIVVSSAQSWRYAALLGHPHCLLSVACFAALYASLETDPCSLKRKLIAVYGIS